jgi:hypothetical protein
MAETIRSAGMSSSVPSMGLDVQATADDLRFASDDPQGNRAAVFATDHREWCHAAANGDAFGQSVFHFVPGGLHLVHVKDGGQRDFRTLAD